MIEVKYYTNEDADADDALALVLETAVLLNIG